MASLTQPEPLRTTGCILPFSESQQSTRLREGCVQGQLSDSAEEMRLIAQTRGIYTEAADVWGSHGPESDGITSATPTRSHFPCSVDCWRASWTGGQERCREGGGHWCGLWGTSHPGQEQPLWVSPPWRLLTHQPGPPSMGALSSAICSTRLGHLKEKR